MMLLLMVLSLLLLPRNMRGTPRDTQKDVEQMHVDIVSFVPCHVRDRHLNTRHRTFLYIYIYATQSSAWELHASTADQRERQ